MELISSSLMRCRSSRGPWKRTQRMLGQNRSISVSQLLSTLSGTTTRCGPLTLSESRRYAMNEMVWIVLPRPIWSPRMAFTPFLYMYTSQLRPMRWCLCSVAVSVSEGSTRATSRPSSTTGLFFVGEDSLEASVPGVGEGDAAVGAASVPATAVLPSASSEIASGFGSTSITTRASSSSASRARSTRTCSTSSRTSSTRSTASRQARSAWL
mmetsp:Transcript_4090/g.11939  ORF Transcript_4090/g.11939 Transcript_4090/m.11939 type:complete len:211 (+) Transcript_4090:226-858(+)